VQRQQEEEHLIGRRREFVGDEATEILARVNRRQE
jgi:hypothetical protein